MVRATEHLCNNNNDGEVKASYIGNMRIISEKAARKSL